MFTYFFMFKGVIIYNGMHANSSNNKANQKVNMNKTT